MLRQLLPPPAVPALPQGLRFVVLDATTGQAPGAQGTDHRLHISLDLVSLEFLEVSISDVPTGETLTNFTLGRGEVASTDRGYCHPAGMGHALAQGAQLLVRLTPFRVVLCEPMEQPLVLGTALQRQQTDTIRTREVGLQSTDGQQQVRGWGHADRLSAAPAGRARHQCRQRHTKGAPKAATLFLAGGGLVFTTLAPTVVSAPTIMALYRCRWQGELAIKRWKSGRDMDALRAKAPSPRAAVWLHGKLLYVLLLERRMRRQLGDPWRRWDHARLATGWRAWEMRQDEITPMMTGSLFWKAEAWEAWLHVLAERPRRRT